MTKRIKHPDTFLPNSEEDYGTPVHVSEEDGGLVFTLPFGKNPGLTTETCYELFSYLHAAPVCKDPETDTFVEISFNCLERKFVASQVWKRAEQDKTWSKIVLVSYAAETSPHLLEIPGPFFIHCLQVGDILKFLVGKAP